MNWTGGQLHRHSARPGGLSRNQKRNFARSRQLIHSKPSGVEPVSFHGSPSFSFSQKQDTADTNQTNVSQPSKLSSGPTNELDTLKRRLLQQSDWAAVSAACPLEAKFATAREFEQFGKRRKLTDNDRKRQAVEHGDKDLRRWTDHLTNNMRPVQQDADLSHLKVHIDGQLAGSNSGTQEPTTHTSSYSMLLDHDEPMSSFSPSLPAQPKSTQNGPCQMAASRLSLPSSHMRAPLHLQPPANNMAYVGGEDHFEYANTTSLSQTGHSRINPTNDSPCYDRVEPEQITFQSSFHPSATDVSPTGPRRFTLDDQFLAEQMQLNTTLNSRQRSPSMLSSSEERPSPSPTRMLTDMSMEPETSSWLQHPQILPYSSSPLRTRDTKLKIPAPHTVNCNFPSSPSLVDEELERVAHPAPVKIFGQSVQLEEGTLGV